MRTVPGGGVVEARDEVDEGGLAGSGWADEGEAGAGGDLEVDVVQDVGGGGSVGVGSRRRTDCGIRCRPGFRTRYRWSARRAGVASRSSMEGFSLEELLDAGDGGGAALEEVHDPADGDDGPGEHHQVGHEGGEVADGDAVGDDLAASDVEHDDHGEAEDDFESRPEHAHELNEAEAATDVLPIGRLEGVDLGLFLGEGANEAGGGEVLLGLRGDVGEHGLDALEALVDLAAHDLHENAGERQRDEGGEGEHGADAQQEVEREDGEEDGVRAVHDAGTEEHADGVEVVGHARHDVAGAALLVVLGGLLLKLQEEVVAEVEFDVAGDADEDPAREEEEDAFGDGDGDEQAGVEEDLLAGHAMVAGRRWRCR